MRTIVFLALFAAAVPAFGQTSPHFIELVRGSGLIFQGTVRAIGKATPTVIPQSNTAVVVVDRVLEALPPVGNPTGREVTVRLRDPNRLKPGQAATFFTYVYSAGATLGLQEVGSLPPGEPTELEQRTVEARQLLS